MSDQRPGRRDRRTRGALVAVVGLLAVGLGTWATADAPSVVPDRTAAAASPVPRASVVCPDPGERGLVSAAILPLTTSTDGAGGTLRIGGPTAAATAASGDGVLDLDGAKLGTTLPVVTTQPATGDLAATVSSPRPRAGAGPCVVAGSRAWFTGLGAEVDHAASLELVNPESGPAVVRMRVLGPEGPVETVDLREVSVPPGERVRIDLAEAAPAIGEMALEVRTSRGRVAAFVTDRVGILGTGRPATDLVPSQGTPRRRVVLGGLPRRADSHVLVVANPTEFETLGTVEIQGPDGTFVPEDPGELRVPPGGTVSLDLTDAVGRTGAAVRVRTDAPVTAVVRSRVGADLSYAGPVRSAGPASGAVLPAGSEATLQLSSDREARTVVVEPYGAGGRPLATEEVEVPPAAMLAVPLPPRTRMVVVRDGGTGVRGAVVLRGEAGIATLPLRPGAARGRAPVVVPVLR